MARVERAKTAHYDKVQVGDRVKWVKQVLQPDGTYEPAGWAGNVVQTGPDYVIVEQRTRYLVPHQIIIAHEKDGAERHRERTLIVTPDQR